MRADLKAEDSYRTDTDKTDWLERIALSIIPGVGPIICKRLLERFGTARRVLNASRFRLEETPGIGWNSALSIRDSSKALKRAEEELNFISSRKIIPLFINDENYPFRLREIPDAPIVLYTKGNGNLNSDKVVSIVGSRRATEEGLDLTNALVKGINGIGASIISGLAYGIDQAAHASACKRGIETFGVLAHGLDRVYPYEHSVLAAEMIQHGGLVTEFISGTKPDRPNFPQRNRLIAGLSDATIVVEAAEKGGALITARLAAEYSRDVFAIPGRTNDLLSVGTNQLIRDQVAGLITNAEDFTLAMNWNAPIKRNKAIEEFVDDLTDTERLIFSMVCKAGEELHDNLYNKSGLKHSELSLALISLELKGMIKALPMKRYRPVLS